MFRFFIYFFEEDNKNEILIKELNIYKSRLK